MKAAVLVGFGGVDQLDMREVPEPETGPGQIKVQVAGSSVNPIDWKLREGAKRPGLSFALPAILGRDAAGVVLGRAAVFVAKAGGVRVWAGVRKVQRGRSGGSRRGRRRRARRRRGRPAPAGG